MRKIIPILGGFYLFLNATLVWALEPVETSSVSLKSESFLSPDYDSTTQKQYHYIGADFRNIEPGAFNRFENLEPGLKISVQGQFAPQASVLSYLNVREMNYHNSNFSIGRQLENWSDLDERWGLGLFQPRFLWNPLTPQSQGLTGAFLRLNSRTGSIPWGVLFFGSNIFVPDQGAGYDVRDGKFEAVNPWFRTPPSQVRFETTGAVDKVHYDVQAPEIGKVVYNSSYAVQAYVGDSQKGFSVSASFAHKPANQLALGLDGQSVAQQETTQVSVRPTFFYHTLLAGDLRYQGEFFETGVGAVREDPKDPKFEPEWTYQTYGPSTLVSPFVGFRLGTFKLRLMTLSVSEPEENPQGPKVGFFGSLLPKRYPFSNAHALEASSKFFWRRHEGLVGTFRYLQGAANEFHLLTTDLTYQMGPQWSFTGQILLVRAVAEGRTKKTVMSDFENNDLAQAGVRYVF